MNPENLWTNDMITIYAVVFVFGAVLFFMMLERKEKEIKPSKIVADISKYSLGVSVILIAIGLVVLTPILNGSETILEYRGQELQEEFLVIWNTAYFRLQFFLRALLGLSILIIGAVIVAPNLFRGIGKLIRGVRNWKT